MRFAGLLRLVLEGILGALSESGKLVDLGKDSADKRQG